MPAKLKRCVEHVKASGKPESSAWPICVASTGLKPHRKTLKPGDTKEVIKRARKQP